VGRLVSRVGLGLAAGLVLGLVLGRHLVRESLIRQGVVGA